jgi:hypothetical protein
MLKYHGLFLQFVSLVGEHYETSFFVIGSVDFINPWQSIFTTRLLRRFVECGTHRKVKTFIIFAISYQFCNQKDLDHHIFW